jgi:hypothetical protein
MAPIYIAWLHFPDRKGLASGIILSGFGFGVFIYNIITNYIVNPDNLPAQAFLYEKETLCGKIFHYYFTKDISDKVFTFLYLICIDSFYDKTTYYYMDISVNTIIYFDYSSKEKANAT